MVLNIGVGETVIQQIPLLILFPFEGQNKSLQSHYYTAALYFKTWGGGGGGVASQHASQVTTWPGNLQGGGMHQGVIWQTSPGLPMAGEGGWANSAWDTWDTTWYRQEAGSTHPTGMLSCWGWIRDDGHIISIVFFALTICNLCKRFAL